MRVRLPSSRWFALLLGIAVLGAATGCKKNCVATEGCYDTETPAAE